MKKGQAIAGPRQISHHFQNAQEILSDLLRQMTFRQDLPDLHKAFQGKQPLKVLFFPDCQGPVMATTGNESASLFNVAVSDRGIIL